MNIELTRLKEFMSDLLIRSGLSAQNAQIVSDIYYRATLRGVGHHDIYDFIWRLEFLEYGKVNPKPNIKLVSKYMAMESYGKYRKENLLGTC